MSRYFALFWPLMVRDDNARLNSFSLMMIFVGFVIGLGIFRTATNSAEAALSPAIFFAAWIIGGIVAYCGALTYAEIGSRLPVTGAYYKIFAVSYHPSIAFALNGVILVSNAASLGGVALIGSEYLAFGLYGAEATDGFRSAVAIVAVAIFYLVNLAGLRISSRVLNVLMIIKIGMLMIMILALFFPKHYAVNPVPFFGDFSWKETIFSLGAALIAVSFTYGGYQQTINFGSEIDTPKSTIPKAYFRGILIILVLYLLVNLSYFMIIGFDDLKTAKGVAGIVAGKLFGPVGNTIFSALLFTAVLAYVNVILMSNPRVMYAMSKDGILPSLFAYRTKQKHVLSYSLTMYTIVVIATIFFAETFDRILRFVIFLDSIGMVTSAATVFYLRKKANPEDVQDMYRMSCIPWPTLVFMAVYCLVALYIAVNNPVMTATGLAVVGLLVGIYFLFLKGKQTESIRH